MAKYILSNTETLPTKKYYAIDQVINVDAKTSKWASSRSACSTGHSGQGEPTEGRQASHITFFFAIFISPHDSSRDICDNCKQMNYSLLPLSVQICTLSCDATVSTSMLTKTTRQK